MGVSKNSGVSPQIMNFDSVFYYKPSTLGGTPIFGNTHILQYISLSFPSIIFVQGALNVFQLPGGSCSFSFSTIKQLPPEYYQIHQGPIRSIRANLIQHGSRDVHVAANTLHLSRQELLPLGCPRKLVNGY